MDTKQKQWRTRIVLYTEAVLEVAEYGVREATLVVQIINDSSLVQKSNDNYRLVDIFLPRKEDENIKEVLVRSHDILDEFIDKICLISYGRAFMHTFLSTCPASVNVDEEFELVTQDFFVKRDSNKINLYNFSFKKYPEYSHIKEAMHFMRNALNTRSSEEKLLMFYTALERLADGECVKTIKERCRHSGCNEEHDTKRKATKKFVEEIFVKYGIDYTQFDAVYKLRNKIAHGSGSRNAEHVENVVTASAKMENMVLSELAERCGVKVQNKQGIVITNLPMTIHKCTKNREGSFSTLNGSSFEFSVQLVEISSSDKRNNIDFGVPLGPEGRQIIHSLAWPE